jgi:hypothetical protein
MKLLQTVLLFLGLIFFSNAQNITLPNKDFAIKLSTENVKISRGETANFTVFILKSKGFVKAKTNMILKSDLPKGVQVEFSPKDGVFDQTVVKISISKDAEIGETSLIIGAEMKLLSKGSIISIQVQ